MIRGGNEDSVDVVALEQAAIISIAFALADLLSAIGPTLIDVAHRGDLDVLGVGFLGQAADVAGAHPADADNADADAVIRADRAESCGRAENGGAGGQCGALEEAAPRSGGVLHARISS